MNENIDLTKILKDCPKGTEFWCKIYGKITFEEIRYSDSPTNYPGSLYPILIIDSLGNHRVLTKDGKFDSRFNDSECVLFPSKDQRDWSKFSAPWYKKEKFDPKTLKWFDKVLVRDDNNEIWLCSLFSHIRKEAYPYSTTSGNYFCCIPFNDDTKYLVGTTDEAPEYYRYWEN